MLILTTNFSLTNAYSQENDTLQISKKIVVIPEIVITAYPEKQLYFRSTTSVNSIDADQLHVQPEHTLLPSLNTIPGVRMEERSPGSYRVSLRGSLLRSPFGVRNIKVYLDEFPLTDASGNTYINLLDPESVQGIEVIKGPEGLFGTNTGGVILFHTSDPHMDSTKISLSLSGGSYGLFHEHLGIAHKSNKHHLSFSQGYQRSDGYRQNSALQRNYLQFSDSWSYRENASLKFLVLFSDLKYETPGGLTLDQWNTNPRDARPATSLFPGASQQHARVANQTIYAGIAHESIFRKFKHIIALFGSHVDFENPFITNYETRNEQTFGFRTFIKTEGKFGTNTRWKWNIGAEAQQTQSVIANHINLSGKKGLLQAKDGISATNAFVFSQFSVDLFDRWITEVAISINEYTIDYQSAFPISESEGHRKKFNQQVLPRLSTSVLIGNGLVWRAAVGKGYSPPSIAEIRPSDNQIYSGLEAETGWNYETGFRLRAMKNRFQADLTGFYFKLNHAIVRRTDLGGNEYFVNAGGTNQMGVELKLNGYLYKERSTGFIRKIQLQNSISYNYFHFTNYQIGNTNFSGNALTGVPTFTVVSQATIALPIGFYLFVQNNSTGKTPLNDANTVFSERNFILQSKIGWIKSYTNWKLELFAGVDNLLNQHYSLGFDLNAVGGRYYNAAPSRNYFGGLKIVF